MVSELYGESILEANEAGKKWIDEVTQ